MIINKLIKASFIAQAINTAPKIYAGYEAIIPRTNRINDQDQTVNLDPRISKEDFVRLVNIPEILLALSSTNLSSFFQIVTLHFFDFSRLPNIYQGLSSFFSKLKLLNERKMMKLLRKRVLPKELAMLILTHFTPSLQPFVVELFFSSATFVFSPELEAFLTLHFNDTQNTMVRLTCLLAPDLLRIVNIISSLLNNYYSVLGILTPGLCSYPTVTFIHLNIPIVWISMNFRILKSNPLFNRYECVIKLFIIFNVICMNALYFTPYLIFANCCAFPFLIRNAPRQLAEYPISIRIVTNIHAFNLGFIVPLNFVNLVMNLLCMVIRNRFKKLVPILINHLRLPADDKIRLAKQLQRVSDEFALYDCKCHH